MLSLDRIYHASFVLKNVLHTTDLIRAQHINPECDVYLKPENLQITGSFKVRGAYYKISQLSDEEKAKGVIACSAGNHAQGSCAGRHQKRYQVADLSAGRCTDLKGGGDQTARCRNLPGEGRI